MGSVQRVYADNVGAYVAAGLPAFPVDARAKRPAVRGWQRATPRRAHAWARSKRLGEADGVGLLMGKSSGLTEIDIDAVGDAWTAAAIERFGETPIVICTASGKAKLWYRHSGERRQIRPIADQPIDVLGDGFTIAPPSWREDLGAGYRFAKGNIDSIADLPPLGRDALGERAAPTVSVGERNGCLWRYCMTQARHCDDLEALIDVAATWSSALGEPLSSLEVAGCARSAWSYEATGRNFIGLKKPQLNPGDVAMDELLDEPEAFVLFQMFNRWHGAGKFAIAPRAMSEAGSPPWPRRRIEQARDVLLERGYLQEVSPPSRGRRKSGRYQLAAKMPRSAHNHYTPSPQGYGQGVGKAGRLS